MPHRTQWLATARDKLGKKRHAVAEQLCKEYITWETKFFSTFNKVHCPAAPPTS
jgi:hypothetical protein